VFQCPAHDHARRDTWPGDSFTTNLRRLRSGLGRSPAPRPGMTESGINCHVDQMLVSLELAAVATVDLSRQYSVFARLHLGVVFGEVGFLIDCGGSVMFDGWVLDWMFLLIQLSADARDTGCGSLSLMAAASLAARAAASLPATPTWPGIHWITTGCCCGC